MNKEIIELNIPFMSISVNSAYNGKIKRVKSLVYQEFENKMYIFFKQLGIEYEITGDKWLKCSYIFNFPLYNKNGTKKKKDVENYLKVLNDVLSYYIKGFKDEYIKEINLIKENNNNEFIKIKIQEID